MHPLIYILIGLTIALDSTHAYRALVVYPVPSRSHANLGDAVVKQLLKDGNEVVYVTTFEYKNAPSNLRQIDVSENIDTFPELSALDYQEKFRTPFPLIQTHTLSITSILEGKIVTNDRDLIMRVMVSIIARTLEIKEVQKLMSDPQEHFDVVIVEWIFNEILASWAPLFGCPLIWMSPVEVNARVLRLVDEMPSPAYSADSLSSIIPPFTFQQRLQELWTRLVEFYSDFMYYDKMQADIYERYIVPNIKARGRKPPTFEKLRFNASLILGNSHVSLGEAARIPQSYKPIGGYHIDENVKPLPEDLNKIMDASKDGVIYFSMGSNLKSKDLPEQIKQKLLKMFGELKQTVLWKFEEDLPNVPNNVHILKWAPQPSILTHPNCILFISHGGLLSTTETIHYGVPVIGIPVFGDQFVNVNRATKKGFALKVDLTYNVDKDLRVAIKEMLSKPIYKERVKQLSHIYHDRTMKPAQEVSHWVRHVVETRGAAHLRSPALNVPLYQRLYLDVIALFVITIHMSFNLLRFACGVVCKKKVIDINKKND